MAICLDTMKCIDEPCKIYKGNGIPIRTEEFSGNITALEKVDWQSYF